MNDQRKTKKELVCDLDDLRRDLQVEAVVERVSALALRMQSRDDIGDAVTVLFEKFWGLGFDQDDTNIMIVDEEHEEVRGGSFMEGPEVNHTRYTDPIRRDLWDRDDPFCRAPKAHMEAGRKGDARLEHRLDAGDLPEHLRTSSRIHDRAPAGLARDHSQRRSRIPAAINRRTRQIALPGWPGRALPSPAITAAVARGGRGAEGAWRRRYRAARTTIPQRPGSSGLARERTPADPHPTEDESAHAPKRPPATVP